MIKKNATLTAIVFSMMIIIGFYLGLYLWIDWNATDAGISLDSKYGAVYNNMSFQESELMNKMEDIKTAANAVTEPSGIMQVAFSGLKGLLSVLTLPLAFIGTAMDMFFAFMTLTEPPEWAKTLLELSILTIMIFVIIAIIKGEPKM